MTCITAPRLLATILVLPVPALRAQTPEAIKQAAETITEAALTHQLAALTVDSLWPRQTPSAALERAAHYVAAQLKSFELEPNFAIYNPPGDTFWIQHYPAAGRAVAPKERWTSIDFFYVPPTDGPEVVNERGQAAAIQAAGQFPATMRFVGPEVPEPQTMRFGRTEPQSTLLLMGRPTPDFLRQASGQLQKHTVLYIPPIDLAPDARQAVVDRLYPLSLGVVVLTPENATQFAARREREPRVPLRLFDLYRQALERHPYQWAVEVPISVLAGILSRIGVDLSRAATATAATLEEPPRLQAWLRTSLSPMHDSVLTVPNVAGMLTRQDEALPTPRRWRKKRSCVVVAAPLDHRGPHSTETDSSARRTDASTVSTAGLLLLAHAFSQMSVQPKHAIAFLATSGGAPHYTLSGSHYFANASGLCRPIASLALDLSVGHPAQDTVVVAGLRDVELATPLAWIMAPHPELGLHMVDGGPALTSRTDAQAFNEHGLPSLLIQAGPTSDKAVTAVGPAIALEHEQVVRTLRFAFHVAYALAEESLPRLSKAGRQRLFGRP